MTSANPSLILILEANLAPTKRNKVRKRLEELGAAVKFVDGGTHPYFEVSGEELPVRTLSPENWPGVVRVVALSPSYPHAAWGPGRGDVVTPTLVNIESPGESEAVSIGPGHFTVLAGPCAVEDAERTVRLAKSVRESGATVFRAGAFKPRTSPYAFQGLGEEGLAILREVRTEVGLPIVTEILDVRHIESVAAVADVLQVGSRSMQNFALLKELSKLRHPVLLKRGFSATVEEFLLAAEYILSGGNDRVVLCERGVRTTGGTVLDLGVVPELRRKSHLPIVVDPSHGSGSAYKVPALARAATAVGCDGLLIEVHDEPDRALSDGQQALSPTDFRRVVEECRAIATALEELPSTSPSRSTSSTPASAGKD